MAGVWPDKARERLGRIFWFCFRNVARTDRMVQKAEAPCGVRKAPEIFCLSFGIRMSRSA